MSDIDWENFDIKNLGTSKDPNRKLLDTLNLKPRKRAKVKVKVISKIGKVQRQEQKTSTE